MINYLTIDNLKVSLEESFDDEGMTNRCVGEAHSGLHILNIREILFTLQDQTFLLLTLEDVGAVTNLHGLFAVVVEAIEVEQSDLLSLIKKRFHSLEGIAICDQLRILGYINLLASFEVGKTFVLTLLRVPERPIQHIISLVTELMVGVSHNRFRDLSSFLTIHIITVIKVSGAGMTVLVVVWEHLTYLPEDLEAISGCSIGTDNRAYKEWGDLTREVTIWIARG